MLLNGKGCVVGSGGVINMWLRQLAESNPTGLNPKIRDLCSSLRLTSGGGEGQAVMGRFRHTSSYNI